jgi:hypothetical protein
MSQSDFPVFHDQSLDGGGDGREKTYLRKNREYERLYLGAMEENGKKVDGFDC